MKFIILTFFFFPLGVGGMLYCMWDLSSLTRDQTHTALLPTPAVEALSLNH